MIRPLAKKAVVLAAAAALLLSACSSGASDDEVDQDVQTVDLGASPDAEPVTPEPTSEPSHASATPEPEATTPSHDDAHGAHDDGHDHGEPVVVDEDTQGAATAADYDPNNPLPVGLTVAEWGTEWDEGQGVVEDYMHARYELSHAEAHPSQWLVRARNHATDDWYSTLQELAVDSNMSDGEWERFQDDEASYSVQVLEPLQLNAYYKLRSWF